MDATGEIKGGGMKKALLILVVLGAFVGGVFAGVTQVQRYVRKGMYAGDCYRSMPHRVFPKAGKNCRFAHKSLHLI